MHKVIAFSLELLRLSQAINGHEKAASLLVLPSGLLRIGGKR